MKVRDYLLPADINALIAARPVGAVDPLDMELADYITAWREQEEAFIRDTPRGEGLNPDQMNARSWFGSAISKLGLPRDEKQMWAMPGEDWVPPVDPRTPGQVNYQTYIKAHNGNPDWSSITDGDKAAWEMAAGAVAEKTRKSLTPTEA